MNKEKLDQSIDSVVVLLDKNKEGIYFISLDRHNEWAQKEILREREACAKVAEDCNKELKILLSNNKISDDLTQKCLISLASKVIAKAIRERK